MDIEKTLSVQKREDCGKGPSGRLRSQELIPGVFYTAKGENITVQAPTLPLEKLYLDETSVDHPDLVYEMPSLKELWLTRSLANTIDIKLPRERNPQIIVDVISGGNIRTYLRKAEEPKG